MQKEVDSYETLDCARSGHGLYNLDGLRTVRIRAYAAGRPQHAVFFLGEVTEAEEEYLRIKVNDIGNSSLSDGDSVEVSTEVVAAKGCPEFTVGEYARVLLARNIEDPSVRLEALSVYKVDETGAILADET